MSKITKEQAIEAQKTLLKYFIQINADNKSYRPLTVLDTSFHIEQDKFRIISFITFY